MTIMEMRICRPDEAEIKALYALMHAAEEVDNRWSTETVKEFKERLLDTSNDGLYDHEQELMVTAWDVLTNKASGGLGRLLASYGTLVATFQDPALDYVAASPAINKMYNDSLIYPELVEGFEDALRHTALLQFELNEAKTLLRHTQEKLGKALLRNSQLSQTPVMGDWILSSKDGMDIAGEPLHGKS